MLDGPRLVTCSELDEGSVFRESRIKSLTGGDPITYRPLYKSVSVTFTPRCKIILAVNRLPQTRDLSPAFWRRVRVVRFEGFEGPSDPDLPDKLRAEAPGILLWAVRGAIEYYRGGLQTPPLVDDATGEYREDSDPLADFLAERCEIGTEYQSPPGELYRVYIAWAEDRGLSKRERLGSRTFGTLLGGRFQRGRTAGSGSRFYKGLRVLGVTL